MEHSIMALDKLIFCIDQYGSDSKFPEMYSILNLDKIFERVYGLYGNVHV